MIISFKCEKHPFLSIIENCLILNHKTKRDPILNITIPLWKSLLFVSNFYNYKVFFLVYGLIILNIINGWKQNLVSSYYYDNKHMLHSTYLYYSQKQR